MKSTIAFFIFSLMYVGAFAQSEFANCSLKISDVKNQIQNETGTPDDEAAFLKASIEALNSCTPTKQQWSSLNKAIKESTKACNEAAAQGMSDLFRGYCNLKIAEMASFIQSK